MTKIEAAAMYRNGYNEAMREASIRAEQILKRNEKLEEENKRLREEAREERRIADGSGRHVVEIGDFVEFDGYTWVVISKDEEGCLTMLGSDGTSTTGASMCVDYIGYWINLEATPFLDVLNFLRMLERQEG